MSDAIGNGSTYTDIVKKFKWSVANCFFATLHFFALSESIWLFPYIFKKYAKVILPSINNTGY